jgi:polyhydroxyalkanoate synthesis repressor PhaR
MTTERLIKKYANRRLYDASQSRHVTLEDVREFIVKGEKIRVVEDKSGDDITRLILLQVIAEQEQFGKPILSTPLLESIIRFYGNGMQEFMARYLEKSVETFMRQQEGVQAQMAKLMTQAPMTAMADIARHNLEIWTRMQEQMAQAFMGQGAGQSAAQNAAQNAAQSAGHGAPPGPSRASEPRPAGVDEAAKPTGTEA